MIRKLLKLLARLGNRSQSKVTNVIVVNIIGGDVIGQQENVKVVRKDDQDNKV